MLVKRKLVMDLLKVYGGRQHPHGNENFIQLCEEVLGLPSVTNPLKEMGDRWPEECNELLVILNRVGIGDLILEECRGPRNSTLYKLFRNGDQVFPQNVRGTSYDRMLTFLKGLATTLSFFE